MKRYKSVEDYISGLTEFHDEVVKLREILNSTELEETVKWGAPCYVIDDKNIVGIGAFKSYFGLWFYQGALIDDSSKVLINAQEGKTKALRQWRMTSKTEIKPRIIKAYTKQAIEISKSGNDIKPDRAKPLIVPTELKAVFSKNAKAKKAFDAMTKGKQREYTEYIGDAKRAETKLKRLEKIIPLIQEGIGLNDKYR